MRRVRDQIEQALNDAGMSHNVMLIDDTPDMPVPKDLYDNQNSDKWDEWLDARGAYAEDYSLLIFEDKGGMTFSSGRNPTTTTDGCMGFAGGIDMDSSFSVANDGVDEHYHDMYNVLHELSHGLDAPTGDKWIGRYFFDELKGGYSRTPTHTEFNTTNECGFSNAAKSGTTYWELLYCNCAQGYLTDQSTLSY